MAFHTWPLKVMFLYAEHFHYTPTASKDLIYFSVNLKVLSAKSYLNIIEIRYG
jgi:hypothetical protein